MISKMIHCIHLAGTIILLLILTGCGGIKTIKPEYKSDFRATRLFNEGEHAITLNSLYDDRVTSEKIGEGYNGHGTAIETWVTGNDILQTIETAVIEQLTNSGFTVIRTKGWNLESEAIPEQVSTDLIIGGKLKTCWVESRPGAFTVSINSKVSFDITLADAKNKKTLYVGQFTGSSQASHGFRTAGDMQNAVSFAMTQAVNKAFQDETVRDILLKNY
jgi:hypothetical protein